MSTASGGPNIVTNGLVLSLDAANTKSYISGSTVWKDLSRGGNDGTLVNSPTFNTGSGGSIVFDGVNDYAVYPSNNSIDVNSFTWSATVQGIYNGGTCLLYIGNPVGGGVTPYKIFIGVVNSKLYINYNGISFSFGNLLNNYYYFLGKYSVVILNIIFVVYAIIYLAIDFLLLKKNVWNRNSKIQIIDVQNNLLRKWTLFLFILYIAISMRLLMTLFFDMINSSFSAGKNQLWISGILWSIIFIKILITPEILFGYNALYKKISEQKKSLFLLSEIWLFSVKKEIKNQQHGLLKDKIYPELTKYLKDIEYLALIENCFRKPKTSATEIAKKLEIPNSHFKFIFKYHSKVSYSEFKKIIKTYDAIQLIESGYLKTNTLEALAIKVGFSSYNPFFTSFKEITGSTPQSYNKQTASNTKFG